MLTLVLTLAMLLSVMVVGAGAATFGDQESITNKEAVDVCTTLNIIGGYEDGTFRPAGNVTRAEMCKMICVALNGGKEPSMGSGLIGTFNDVAVGDWAAPYIEYCVSEGIVGGVGGGRFDPNGNITGTQAAKMLLCILGYNASIQGYVGNDFWETKINVDAAQKHLYDGLESIDASAPLTRDQAAQMIWNALQAYEVEYNTTLVTGPNGELTSKVTVQDKVVNAENNKKITLLKDKYDAYINVGTLTSVAGSNLSIDMSTADVADSDSGDEDFTKLGVDYSDLMGQKVKVVFKSGKANNVLGVYATDENTVYNTVANSIEKSGDKVKFDGTSYSIEYTKNKGTMVDNTNSGTGLKTYRDGVEINSLDLNDLDALTCYADSVKFVDSNDNGKIDTVLFTTVTMAKVTYISSTEIIAGNTSYKYEDENIASNIAKDDYVVITENLFDECKDVVKATKISGSVTGYKDADNSGTVTVGDKYMIDGQWYIVTDADSMNSIQVGNTVDAWVYNGTVAYAKRTAGESGNVGDICVITAMGSNIEGNKVKILTFDGKETIVTYDDEDHSGDGYVAPSYLKRGVAYEYEVVKDEYRFKPLNNTPDWYGDYTALDVTTNNSIKDSAGKIDTTTNKVNNIAAAAGVGAKGTVVADSAKVILVTNTNVDTDISTKVITGKQLKALTIADVSTTGTVAAFTSDVDGVTRVTYAVIKVASTIPSDFNTNDSYGYITADAYSSDVGYITYKVWTGKEEVPVVEKKSSISGRTEGTVIGYSSINNGEISDVTTSIGTTEGAIMGVNEAQNKVTFNGVDQFNITADTVVLFIDTDKHEGQASGTIQKADKFGGSFMNNVIYKTDGTDEVELLIVDTKNKLHGDITLSGAGLTGADINAALVSGDVTVTGTLPASVTVPAGRTLTVATLDQVVTVNGNLVVTSAAAMNKVDGCTSTTVGATITLRAANTAGTHTWANVFTAIGSAPVADPATAGVARTVQVANTALVAGTVLTYGTTFTDTSGTTANAWVASAQS